MPKYNFDTIKRDTGCFSTMQFFVGDTGIPFTTEQDAKNALKLAGFAELQACDELADKIRDVLP